MEAYCRGCQGFIEIDGALVVKEGKEWALVVVERRAHEIIAGTKLKKYLRVLGHEAVVSDRSEVRPDLHNEDEPEENVA